MESNTQKEEIEIDLGMIFRTLWHKKIIIILLGIIGAFSGLLFTKFIIVPQYQSVTKVYVMNKQDSSQTTYSDLQTSTFLTKDFQVLIVSRPVLEQVISDLSLTYSPEELEKNIEVTAQTDTRILSITVTDEDPFMAKKIADSVRDISREKIVKVMDIEAVNVVEEGNIAEEAVNTKYMRNILLGALILVIITAGVLVVRAVLDDSVKTPEDVERYLGTSVLGVIPESQQQHQARSSAKSGKKSGSNTAKSVKQKTWEEESYAKR